MPRLFSYSKCKITIPSRLWLAGVLSVLTLGFAVPSALAQEIVDRSFTGASTAENPVQAKREIFDKGQSKVLAEVVEELMGAENYRKNRALVQEKILKLGSRFIPFSKQGELLSKEKTKEMSVQFRVSLSELRTALGEAGLLGDREKLPVVLPLIMVKDRIKKSGYHWWSGEPVPGSFARLYDLFEQQVMQTGFKSGFLVLRPGVHKFSQFPVVQAQTEFISAEAQKLLAQQFRARLILKGLVELDQVAGEGPKVALHFVAFVPGNLKPVAEVSRQFEVTYGVLESIPEMRWQDELSSALQDLYTQVSNVWTKGGIAQQSVLLAFSKWLGPAEQERFRDAFKNHMAQVKSIKTRRLSREGVEFEVETNLQPEELIKRIKGLQIEARPLVVKEATNDRLLMEW